MAPDDVDSRSSQVGDDVVHRRGMHFEAQMVEADRIVAAQLDIFGMKKDIEFLAPHRDLYTNMMKCLQMQHVSSLSLGLQSENRVTILYLGELKALKAMHFVTSSTCIRRVI